MSENHESRLAKVEAAVGELTVTIRTFIEDSAEHRRSLHKDQSKMWDAIEKVATKGQISWGMIVSTGGLIVALITAGAAVNNRLMESRIRQVEIQAQADDRLDSIRFDHEKEMRRLTSGSQPAAQPR